MERIQKCPRFSTICSAVDGDEIAMEKILNHYNAYISKACLRPCYDEYGSMRIVVDMDLKGRVINANIRMYRNDHLKMYKITL